VLVKVEDFIGEWNHRKVDQFHRGSFMRVVYFVGNVTGMEISNVFNVEERDICTEDTKVGKPVSGVCRMGRNVK